MFCIHDVYFRWRNHGKHIVFMVTLKIKHFELALNFVNLSPLVGTAENTAQQQEPKPPPLQGFMLPGV